MAWESIPENNEISAWSIHKARKVHWELYKPFHLPWKQEKKLLLSLSKCQAF